MTNFLALCGLPVFLEPWIALFYSPLEMELLKAMDGRATVGDEVRKTLGPDCTNNVLDRAWRRGVVNRLDDDRLAPSDFHDRFEIWALFEGWQNLPEDIRDQLNQWEIDHYADTHRRVVEALKRGQPRPKEKICPDYLLLDEVAHLFQRIQHFYLWPCNCRAMVRGCSQSRYTCIRFSNHRGIGWEISRERALSIVESANRKGLMQSAELGVDAEGRFDGALCNCCNDCCFPHQLARILGAEKIWPLSRYLATLAPEPCNGCGRRCPFGAISQEKKRKEAPPPVIDTQLCRGCGVCATGCPQAAIRMQKIADSVLDSYYA